MELNLNGIPEELKMLANWVNWTVEERTSKPTKIPINPKTGGRAQSNNPSTWGTYDQAVHRWKESENGRIEGIGFMFSDGYSGVDLDKCRDPESGQIEPWAKQIVEQLNSYTEISPSGTGLHTIIKGSLPKGTRRRGKIEMYDKGRYFTVTGWHLEGVPPEIHHREDELRAIHNKIFGNERKPKSDPSPGNSFCLSDADLIKKSMEATNGDKFRRLWEGDWSGYLSQSEADLALCSMLAFWTRKDPERIDSLFRQSGLIREKWNQPHFGDGSTYGQTTIQKAIDGVTESYSNPTRNWDNLATDQRDSSEAERETQLNPETPFPKEAIQGLAGEFADLYSSYLESPWSFFAFSFLTFLGLIVSDKIKLLTQTKPQPRLYTVLIGQSGRGRKSEALSQVQDFFDYFRHHFKKCGGVGSSEGLIHWVNSNFPVTDANTQSIKKAIIIYDEFESFVQKVKIESSTLSQAIRTLFRLNEYENQTKGTKDGRIKNFFLSLLGACTQEVFQTMWESDHISGGTLNRFWLVKENTTKVIPIARPIPEEKIQALRGKLSLTLNSLPPEQTFSIDDDALEYYSCWYIEQNKDTSEFAVRLEEYAERLALLLAFNRNRTVVDLRTVEDTITLIKWQRQVREDCFPQVAVGVKARVEARIRTQVRKHARTGITQGQINHKIKAYNFDTWIVEQSYKGLERAGHIVMRNGRYFPGPNMPQIG